MSAVRVPDLTPELLLMTDDIQSARARPVRRRLTQVVDALERVRARYAICGAVAMGAHGHRRFTEDIDVLVADEDLEPVVGALAGSMREIGREPASGRALQIRLRSKRARATTPIDAHLLVPIDAVEAWALATAVRGVAYDRKVDVVSPEAVVVMKLRAYLSDPDSRAGGKHRNDAMELLATGAVEIDTLRQFVRTNADLAAELERILAAPPPRSRVR